MKNGLNDLPAKRGRMPLEDNKENEGNEEASFMSLEKLEKMLENQKQKQENKERNKQKKKDTVAPKEKAQRSKSTKNADISKVDNILLHNKKIKELNKLNIPHYKVVREKLLERLQASLQQGDKIDLTSLHKLNHNYWKIPPVPEAQRKRWKETWGKAILAVAKKRGTFLIDIKELITREPFKGMRIKHLRKIINWLKEENLARWINGERTTFIVYWKTKKELAEKIYKKASELRVPMLSLDDLQKIYDFPTEELRDVLKLIDEKKGVRMKKQTLFFHEHF